MDTRPQQLAVFGGAEPAPVNRRALIQPKAAGYAARPGTGPEGETCGSCGRCRFKLVRGRRVYKCGAMAGSWTRTRESDVCKRSPACSQWLSGTPLLTGRM